MTLKPLYQITRRDYRNAHLYKIVGEEREYKSVTHYTGVIDKSGPLMGWAARTALDGMRKVLYAELGDKMVADVRLDIETIDRWLERAAGLPKEKKDEAANYGTMTHDAIDEFVRGGGVKWGVYDPVIQPAINSFLRWWGKGRRIIACDTYVVSRKYGFGGAFDAIEERADGLHILDYKSSNGCYPEMAIQVGGGYSLAFQETFGDRPSGADIVRFGKAEPEVEVREVKNLHEAEDAFISCLNLKTALSRELFKPKEDLCQSS